MFFGLGLTYCVFIYCVSLCVTCVVYVDILLKIIFR